MYGPSIYNLQNVNNTNNKQSHTPYATNEKGLKAEKRWVGSWSFWESSVCYREHDAPRRDSVWPAAVACAPWRADILFSLCIRRRKNRLSSGKSRGEPVGRKQMHAQVWGRKAQLYRALSLRCGHRTCGNSYRQGRKDRGPASAVSAFSAKTHESFRGSHQPQPRPHYGHKNHPHRTPGRKIQTITTQPPWSCDLLRHPTHLTTNYPQ